MRTTFSFMMIFQLVHVFNLDSHLFAFQTLNGYGQVVKTKSGQVQCFELNPISRYYGYVITSYPDRVHATMRNCFASSGQTMRKWCFAI